MVKSNSKVAKDAIRAYIMDNTTDYNEQPITGTFQEIAGFILDCLYTEKIKYCNRGLSLYGSAQNAFIDWCEGLPSVFDTSYYYLAIARNLLGDILQETESERAQYTESEAENMLTKLFWREISAADRRWLQW